MIQEISVYCPAAISFIFRAFLYDDPLQTGSTGVGCTLDRGVTVTVSKAPKTEIVFNNDCIEFPTTQSVIGFLTVESVRVEIESAFPLACGFGISGASALATAYALNQLFSTHMDEEKLLAIAHRAEILNKTGLGTVGTQWVGGFLLKNKPGLPVIYTKLPFVGNKLYSRVFAPRQTAGVISKSVEKINTEAQKALQTIEKNHETLSDIFRPSYIYARDSGLLSGVCQNYIETVQKSGGNATMHMVGDVVVSDTAISYERGQLYEYNVSNDRVRVL